MALMNNYPVNRSDFRIIRGVQNEILFRIRDLDRNAAVITQFQSLTINIVNPVSSDLLLSRFLTIYHAASSIYMLTVGAGETVDWETGPLRWSIAVTRLDGTTMLLWTDMGYSPYSILEVTEPPIPGPRSPLTLDPNDFIINSDRTYSTQLVASAQLGYRNGAQSFAIYPQTFTGVVMVQATLMTQPQERDWFGVVTRNYLDAGTVDLITTIGNFVWLRVVIGRLIGSIRQIIYTN